jgi:HSP20 family protein
MTGEPTDRKVGRSKKIKIINNLNIGGLIMIPVRKYNNQNWLPSIFNDFFDNDWMVKTNATAPAINVIESDKDYKVEVAAPGMTKDDFNIHLSEDNELVITMEKKNETKEEDKENKKYLRREFSYSKFQQALVLPDDVEKEKINANVSDGVLTIELPKRTPEEKAKISRQIEIH